MAIAPCDLCGARYLGSSITGYHSWYTENVRVGYKQRICPACAKQRMSTYVQWGVDQHDENAPFPESCPACGASLEADCEPTYSTWYRGKQRKDLVLFACELCSVRIRAVFETGGVPLANRPVPVGSGEGRPSPEPQEGNGDSGFPW